MEKKQWTWYRDGMSGSSSKDKDRAARRGAVGAGVRSRSSSSLSSVAWVCLHEECGRKMFRDFPSLDQHLQRFHLSEPSYSRDVCLADYCDVLDCKHRGKDDPTMLMSMHSAVGSRAAYARVSRGERASAASATAASLSHAVSFDHPALDSDSSAPCSSTSMERARLKCENILLQCFPMQSGGLSQAGGSLSSAEAHALYERFHADLCESLHCTPHGTHVNADILHTHRTSKSMSTLAFVFFIILLLCLAAFYIIAFLLRGEFGWGRQLTMTASTTTTSHAHTSNTLTHASRSKERQQSRLASWLGIQEYKKRTAGKLM